MPGKAAGGRVARGGEGFEDGVLDHQVSVIEPLEHGSGFNFGIGVNVKIGQEGGDVCEGHAAEPELAPGFGDAFDGGEEGGGEGEQGEGGQLGGD